MLGENSRGPYCSMACRKVSTMSGEISSGMLWFSAMLWNRPISFSTRSMVKLMLRLPLRMIWLSVSWTKELPDEILIASNVVLRSMPAAFIVTSASAQVIRFAVAR